MDLDTRGVCVPYRRRPVGPPYTLHLQGVAKLVQLDDPEADSHYEAGRLARISRRGALEIDGACFVRITPTATIHSFGPGVPVLDLVRNPLETGARSALLIGPVADLAIPSLFGKVV